MSTDEFKGKRIAVIGLAATGLATARVLREAGAARVTLCDGKSESALPPERIAEARALGEGVSLRLGTDALDWDAIDLVIPSPGVPRHAEPLGQASLRGVPVMGEIEAAYRLARAPILAVTGTNGKTTTVALLGAICREAGWKTWVAGNIAEDAGVRVPLIQAAWEAPEDGVIVAEISSFQLEWVERFRPRVGAWLNLSDDHLDRHADQDEYARAKANLLRAQEPGDVAVLNADDPLVMRYGGQKGGGAQWEFSLHGPVAVGTYLDGDTLVYAADHLHRSEERVLLDRDEIPLPGLHNVANVLAAAAVALAFNIAPADIARAVREFTGVPHRMELVAVVGGVRYVNNSMCTNPAAVAASLQAVAERPIIAIAGGKHKGGSLQGMVNALQERTRHVVLIGESAREIGEALENAVVQAEGRGPSVEYAGRDLPGAVRRAALIARPGDTVILIPGCASFDMFSGFEQRGQVFRDAVRSLIRTSDVPTWDTHIPASPSQKSTVEAGSVFAFLSRLLKKEKPL